MYDGPVELQKDIARDGYYCRARSLSFPQYSMTTFGATAEKAEAALRGVYYELNRSIAWKELGKGTYSPR